MVKDTSGKTLNKEQLSAIKHKNGPLLIIAGAGTGKTTVITERIKHLIVSKLAKPEEILALTFTEKAAHEMEERVDRIMPYGYTQMWIMTFHSFCDRVLRDNAIDIGLNPAFDLMTESESVAYIKKHLFEFKLDYFRPLGNPNKFIIGLLKHFSRLADEDISPEAYLSFSKNNPIKDKLEIKKIKELAGAYIKYNTLKDKDGVMDFSDLIVKTLKLFRERANILSRYKKTFKYILVDEYQDTNISQNEIVKLLAGKAGNITTVADDDQSIFAFRGASISNVIWFRKNYRKAKLITLTKNYRSTQSILDGAYKLIQYNNPDRLEAVEKIDKKLVSQVSGEGTSIEFVHTQRVENEAEAVVGKIEELVEEGYSWGDFAILVRANSHADPFIASFLRRGIPHQFLGPGKLFCQDEVIDLISYLKVLSNPLDSTSLMRLLTSDQINIPISDISIISAIAKKNYISLYEALNDLDKYSITDKSKQNIKNIVSLIKDHQDLLKKESPGRVLYLYLEETGYLQKLVKASTAGDEKITMNISRFFEKVKMFETTNPKTTISDVVDWIDLSLELGESPLATQIDWAGEDAVNILTIHSAKGLEFLVVFLVNLVSQRFPSMERKEIIPIPDALVKEILPVGNFHVEEERRLFYVGVTRAKERLFLTAADYYGDGIRQKKLSPFIAETIGQEAVCGQVKKGVEQLSFLSFKRDKPLSQDSIEVSRPKINYLSYSQIETFNICPLHYKLKYIYKLPSPESASASFGISIHKTLADFYKKVISGNKPTEKLILDLYKGNWVGGGYENRSHRDKFYKKGTDYLKGYLKEGFDQKMLPVSLEEKFVIPVSKDLKVGGTIDRIDAIDNNFIEIIDYKTGASIPTQKEVDKNLQLSIYALASTLIDKKPYVKDPENIRLSLYFLDTQEKITTTRTEKQLNKAKEEILATRKAIEESDFTCSGGYLCQGKCEYYMFCKGKK